MSIPPPPMPAGTPTRVSAGIVVLATLAVITGLYYGRELLVPIALAGLFTALLRPLVRRLERVGLSAPIGGTVVMLVLLGLTAVGVSSLSGPLHQWVAQAPDTFAAAQARLQSLRRPFQAVASAVQKIERTTTGGPGGAAPARDSAGDSADRSGAPGTGSGDGRNHVSASGDSGAASRPADAARNGAAGPASNRAPTGAPDSTHRSADARSSSAERGQGGRSDAGSTASSTEGSTGGSSTSGGGSVASIAARVFGTTTAVLAGIVEVVLLTFLLLASGDKFLTKLVRVLPLRSEKREAVAVAHEVEGVVSRYLVATALINLGQGALVGTAMALLHVPNPVLWGLLTFLLEFIPFLGGASLIILLSLVGLATFDSPGQALLPPAIYLTITTLQNNLVSPVAYGQRLRLNPVAVFVGVLFWYALWGVPGAFLAVPLVAALRILGDHIDGLAPLGEFLSE